MQAEDIEFMRWKAERWIKAHHIPKALKQNPIFILRNMHRMFGHTFRGSTVRSLLGFEDENAVFERYRMIRRAERSYL